MGYSQAGSGPRKSQTNVTHSCSAVISGALTAPGVFEMMEGGLEVVQLYCVRVTISDRWVKTGSVIVMGEEI